MFVALGMAEIVSAVPTSGGPYFWAAILAPPGQAAFWSWITGWLVLKILYKPGHGPQFCDVDVLTNLRFNLLGQVAVTTGITFGCAGLISTTATVNSSYTPTAARTIGIYAALLSSHVLVNSFGV